MKNHSHLIEIDLERKELTIFRVDDKGKKTLYTSTELPELDIDNDADKFKELATMLGENILFDSPVVRRLYKI